MEKSENKNRMRILRQIVFPLCVVATLVFIFSNSLQTGSESAAMSGEVVDMIQTIAKEIAQDSFVATATGTDYEKLHAAIRSLAHFTEFAILGVFVSWTYFSYLTEKRFFPVAFTFLVCIPIWDEYLQSTVNGRGAQISDVFVDTLGGFCGFLFGWGIWAALVAIKNKKAARKAAKGE